MCRTGNEVAVKGPPRWSLVHEPIYPAEWIVGRRSIIPLAVRNGKATNAPSDGRVGCSAGTKPTAASSGGRRGQDEFGQRRCRMLSTVSINEYVSGDK